MAGEPVVTPTLDAADDTIVDWLELVAFFNEFRTARLDELDGAFNVQFEGRSDGDIGAEDATLERMRERIENEVNLRNNACDGAYPFFLSDGAEELVLVEKWMEDKYIVYISCLLASHLTKGLFDFEVEKEFVSRLRNRVFQVVSTLALSGFVDGSAVSIGWPRENQGTILEALGRAVERGAGFQTRVEPGPDTPPQAKDDGIDVIAWRVEQVSPPSVFCYGQVASGRNWSEKSVSYKTFEDSYMIQGPKVKRSTATMIPFRVLDEVTWRREHYQHGRILERTRVPKYAAKGLDAALNGLETDEAKNMQQVTQWVEQFRDSALA